MEWFDFTYGELEFEVDRDCGTVGTGAEGVDGTMGRIFVLASRRMRCDLGRIDLDHKRPRDFSEQGSRAAPTDSRILKLKVRCQVGRLVDAHGRDLVEIATGDLCIHRESRFVRARLG